MLCDFETDGEIPAGAVDTVGDVEDEARDVAFGVDIYHEGFGVAIAAAPRLSPFASAPTDVNDG